MSQTESETSERQNEYINLIKQLAITEKSHYGQISRLVRSIERNLVKQFELGEWEGPVQDISKRVRQDLKNEGLTPDQIHDAVKTIQPEHKRPYEKGTSPLSDEEFKEEQESVFDMTEEFAEQTLSDSQLDKLSDAERMEVLQQEIGTRKSRKTIDNDRIKHLQEYAEKKGITLVEKVTKQLPPENLRGFSETYYLLEEMERRHEVLSNMFKDLKQQVYNFKPSEGTDKKAIEQLEKHIAIFNNYSKVTIQWCKGIETIMRNITDEKYSETNSGWMRNAEDKFMSYGNHGSGEVNAVLTNRVILKLGSKEVKDEDGNVIKTVPVVIKTPVKRETTREELGDMSTFQLAEFQGQMQIKCPECKLEFNKPIVPDEQMDLIAGDLFHQAKTTLLNDGLSNAIDALANNVVSEGMNVDVEAWFKEEFKKQKGREPTKQEVMDMEIQEGKPEKIKTVDIDPKDVVEKRHGMLRNAATRRADKAEHFSKEA